MAQGFGIYDYVIVGGGTAGCLLANRLSADPLVTVLLLEAGGKDNSPWVHVPVGYLYCVSNPTTDWCFRTANEAGLKARSIEYARGKVLGGCSTINGMVYIRGQARDYENWRASGNAGWGWEEVLPYFKRHEDFVQGESAEHGIGGEWRVEEQRAHWPIVNEFRDACIELGIPLTPCFNRGDNFGVGYFHVNQRRGVRVNASKAFLHSAKGRENLHVVTHAQAKSIQFQERRASGLTFDHRGQECQVHARREVVLCAGSICTPQLLELSGVGQLERLRALGIKPILDLPGVGENLQDHLQIPLVYKVKNASTLNELSDTLAGKAQIAAEYALKRSGPMSMHSSQLGVFTKSDPSQTSANIQFHVQPFSVDRFGDSLHSFPAITVSVCNLRPTSRGSVHATSPDFQSPPKIQPNYLSTQEDRKVLVDSIRIARKILGARALATHEPEEIQPGLQYQSDAELELAAAELATTKFHPVGTARMGRDHMAVVDERLRVHGLTGLRIVDASVMPSITSGNTNGPTLMIAEKAAEMIIQEHNADLVFARLKASRYVEPNPIVPTF
ncbi:GMC family oxidoreductase [Noviherbaspirillum denitrificans]|uniref:GMC family oxidoreductase n=1 Tax=Noviherbaspirillum denitrificans TaxID=1968433 RepID=UPI000B53617B|nr:GMC family oxidoreductase N-terminal domain-containing protein [Noviherbaspirillum denitrificans]